MNYKTYLIIISIILLNLATGGCSQRKGADNRIGYYESLSEALDKEPIYEATLLSKKTELKQKIALTKKADARYFYNKLLAELYLFNNCDSALYYIDRNMDIARSENHPGWYAECLITRAKTYMTVGLLEEADNALTEARKYLNSPELLLEYYMQRLFYWNSQSAYHNVPLMPETRQFADSLYVLATREVNDNYVLWAKYYMDLDSIEKKNLRLTFMERIDQLEEDDPWYSPMCHSVGTMSSEEGDIDNEVKYYVKSLLIDLQHSKKQLPGLSVIAFRASQDDELDYANKFMEAHLSMLDAVPDRAFSGHNRYPMMMIKDATINRIKSDRTAMRIMLCVAVLLLMTSMALYVRGRRNYKRIKTLHRKLEESNAALHEKFLEVSVVKDKLAGVQEELVSANARLKESNEALQGRYDEVSKVKDELAAVQEELLLTNKKLKESNSQLIEANYLKEHYIGEGLSMCSDYLNRLDDLKIAVNVNMRARQYDKVLRLTDPHATDSHKNVNDFYAHFDRLFLSIFPDFLDRFNELLQPEHRIQLATKGHLTNDLRIYALIRLGINNSVKIASILRLSSQSVYNARMKMRNKATPDDKPFHERVAALGKAVIKDNSESE